MFPSTQPAHGNGQRADNDIVYSPQTTTAPVIPSSGQPGLLLHGASSSRKRVNQQEDPGELWPKRVRPVHDPSSLRPRSDFGSGTVVPKIESPLSESRHRGSEPQQTLQDVPVPLQEASLAIKREADDLARNNSLNHTGGSYIPVYPHNTRWDANSHQSYAPLNFEDASLQSALTTTHTLCPPSNIPSRAENGVQDATQQEFSTISSWLAPISNFQHWPLGTTQPNGWSTIPQIDPAQFADHISLYANVETSFPDVYSEQFSTLSELSPNVYQPLNDSTDTGSPHRQQSLQKWYSSQSIQKADGVESTDAQPVQPNHVSQDLHAYLEPIGSQFGYFKEGPPILPLQQWSAQGPPHDTFTGNQDAIYVPDESSVSAEWSQDIQPIHTPSEQSISKVRSSGVAPVKVETHIEAISTGASASPQSPYGGAIINTQENFHRPQPAPSFSGLSSNRRPHDPRPQWSIPPDHDPAVLFACQSSRQDTDELVTGASNASLKPRKQFNEGERQETSRTRDIGACVRCKMQRVRVSQGMFSMRSIAPLTGKPIVSTEPGISRRSLWSMPQSSKEPFQESHTPHWLSPIQAARNYDIPDVAYASQPKAMADCPSARCHHLRRANLCEAQAAPGTTLCDPSVCLCPAPG